MCSPYQIQNLEKELLRKFFQSVMEFMLLMETHNLSYSEL